MVEKMKHFNTSVHTLQSNLFQSFTGRITFADTFNHPVSFFTERWRSQRRLCSRRSRRPTMSTSTRAHLSQKAFAGQTEMTLRIKAFNWVMEMRWGTDWRSKRGPASRPRRREQRDCLQILSMVPSTRMDSKLSSKWLWHRNRTAILCIRGDLGRGRTLRNMCRGRTRWLRWSSGSKFIKVTHRRGQFDFIQSVWIDQTADSRRKIDSKKKTWVNAAF